MNVPLSSGSHQKSARRVTKSLSKTLASGRSQHLLATTDDQQIQSGRDVMISPSTSSRSHLHMADENVSDTSLSFSGRVHRSGKILLATPSTSSHSQSYSQFGSSGPQSLSARCHGAVRVTRSVSNTPSSQAVI